MTRIGPVLLTFVLAFHSTASFADAGKSAEEVLTVVEGMDAAWSDQDIQQSLSYFAVDVDFENSFGWVVRGREDLGRFLEWLFARYPKPDPSDDDGRTAATVEFLTPTLAFVESAQIIPPPREGATARTFRTTHLVKYQGDNWLIWKTRVWEAKSSNVVPDDIAAPRQFPEQSKP